MPYDPQPVLPPDAEQVTVYASARDGTPALLLVLTRAPATDAAAGCVWVQEWPGTPADERSLARPPEPRPLPADEVYARAEDASRRGFRLSVDLRELRAWLDRATRR